MSEIKNGGRVLMIDNEDNGNDWPTMVGKIFTVKHTSGYDVKWVVLEEEEGAFVAERFEVVSSWIKPESITAVNLSQVMLDEDWPVVGLTPADLQIATEKIQNMFTTNKYAREIKPGVFVDVYDVLNAFKVTDPCLQHLIKKALAVGQRGHKDATEDYNDILASAKRAVEINNEWKGVNNA